MKKIVIYTDGSCLGNPGPGGWAALLIYNDIKKEISGGEQNSTNNRMEMMAAISALELLKEPCNVQLFTDSKYLQNGMISYMPKWRDNNWRKSGGEIKNLELWKKLSDLSFKHNIEWCWVKAHNGDVNNELVNDLAIYAANKFKNNLM